MPKSTSMQNSSKVKAYKFPTSCFCRSASFLVSARVFSQQRWFTFRKKLVIVDHCYKIVDHCYKIVDHCYKIVDHCCKIVDHCYKMFTFIGPDSDHCLVSSLTHWCFGKLIDVIRFLLSLLRDSLPMACRSYCRKFLWQNHSFLGSVVHWHCLVWSISLIFSSIL